MRWLMVWVCLCGAGAAVAQDETVYGGCVDARGAAVPTFADAQLPQHFQAAFQFDAMPLAVVEAQRLDMRIALKRPGQAGGAVLAAGEEHQGRSGVVLEMLAHSGRECASGGVPTCTLRNCT